MLQSGWMWWNTAVVTLRSTNEALIESDDTIDAVGFWRKVQFAYKLSWQLGNIELWFNYCSLPRRTINFNQRSFWVRFLLWNKWATRWFMWYLSGERNNCTEIASKCVICLTEEPAQRIAQGYVFRFLLVVRINWNIHRLQVQVTQWRYCCWKRPWQNLGITIAFGDVIHIDEEINWNHL